MTRKLYLSVLVAMGCVGPQADRVVVDGVPASDHPMPPPQQSLVLSAGDLFLGETGTFTVSGAEQGDVVEVIRGGRIGFGPCPAVFGGNCLDITGPPVLRIGGAGANAQGVAEIDVDLPALTRLAGPHFFQAVVREDAAMSGDANESLPILKQLLIPECEADSFEPNDDEASAATVSGTNLTADMCADGADWYTRTVADNEIIELGLFSQGGTLDLALYDGAGNLLMDGNASGAQNRDLAWRNRTGAPLDVTIAVTLVEDTQLPGVAYELDVDLSDPAPCVDDPVEDNDTEATALASVFGQSANLQSCDNDPDVFEIVLTQPAGIEVDITYDEDEGSVRSQLFDSQGNLLVDRDPANGFAGIRYGGVAGTYYLHVLPEFDDTYGGGVPYTLEVNSGPPTACFPDGFEPNDVSGDAVLLTPGTYDLLGACLADSFDWYVVDVPAGSTLRVAANFINANGNINLALYENPPATGTAGATAVSATTRDEEVVIHQPTVDTQIWFAVYITQDQGQITGGNFYEVTVEIN